MMIGKNSTDKTSLGNFMTGTQNSLPSRTAKQCLHLEGRWQRNKLNIVQMPNFLSLPVEKFRLEMKKCVALCPPGPNVLLLLVKPFDFSEEDRRKLLLYLQFFGEDALKHSLVVMMDAVTSGGTAVNQLIQDCGERQYQSCFDERGLQTLMEKMVSIVSENQGRHLTFMQDADPMAALKSSHTPLNLLLCGTGKSSGVGAILGWNSAATDQPANGLRTAEVCGRQVSVVELPTLLGKKADIAKKESYRCLSLCEPQGVHALVLVVALDHIAHIIDEDLRELDAIRSTFSSHVTDFTMALFTTKTKPNAPAVIYQKQSKNFQMLSQSCGGRYVILNINDTQQVQDLLHAVDTMSALGSRTFTRTMIPKPQVNMLTRTASVMKARGYRHQIPQQHKMAQEPQTTQVAKPQPQPRSRLQPHSHPDPLTLLAPTNPTPTRESLRIVLVGKTGCGKSATANCILGGEQFYSELSMKSVTTVCEKKEGVVDGRRVTVVDTPGLFDTRLSNTEIQRELVNCISMLAPGPHVFLLVLSIGRFTKEEKETVELIKKFFGKRAGDFTVLLFTKRDMLRDKTLDSFLEESDEVMRNLISECGGRYMAFNSTDLQDRGQVKQLLNIVEAMVKRNEGGYYTSGMFIDAEEAIRKEKQKILKSKEGTIARETREVERQCSEELQAKKRAFSQLKQRNEQEKAECERLFQEQEKRIRLEEQRTKKARQDREKEEEDNQELQRRLEEEERMRQELMEEEKKLQNIVEDGTSVRKILLTQNVQELRKQQEAAERERKEWWENRCRVDEEKRQQEQVRLSQLIEEHKQQMRIYERKKEEAESEWMEAQQKCMKKMEEVKRKHEEQARKQAEENNEFKQRYTREIAAERKKYEYEVQQMRKQQERQSKGIITQLTKNKAYRKDYDGLKKRQEDEVRNLKSTMCFHNKDDLEETMRELQHKHQEEINDWIEEHVQMASNNGHCTIL